MTLEEFIKDKTIDTNLQLINNYNDDIIGKIITIKDLFLRTEDNIKFDIEKNQVINKYNNLLKLKVSEYEKRIHYTYKLYEFTPTFEYYSIKLIED